MPTVIRVLPDGRVRIHYFVHDEAGVVHIPDRTLATSWGPKILDGTKGYIACQPEVKDVMPKVMKGQVHPLVHSNDPRAVTCPDCHETEAYKSVKALLETTLDPQE